MQMRVCNKYKNGGVSKIEIPLQPFPSDQKFYIQLTFKNNRKNVTYIENTLLIAYSTVIMDNDSITLKITSARKVSAAINILLKDNRYRMPGNQELIQALKTYKEQCNQHHAKKPRRSLAYNSKLLSNYEELPDSLPASAKPTRVVCKKKNTQKRYVHKENLAQRSIANIEVFNAECYRLLLGDRHPEVENAHDQQGQSAGLLSLLFPHFTSIYDYLDQQQSYNPNILADELLKKEIVKVWAAAYIEQEYDLHGDNYGIGPDGYIVKIDDDQSNWSDLTAKYNGCDFSAIFYNADGSQVVPIDAFPVTASDITNFPFLRNAKPNHWPTGNDLQAFTEPVLRKLQKDPRTREQLFYVLLTFIITPSSVYEARGSKISSPKIRNKAVVKKIKRQEEFKQVLLNLPEFQNYIEQNPTVIEEIIKEFQKLNQNYTKEKHAFMRVNTESVEQNFTLIQQQIAAQRTVTLSSLVSQSLFTENVPQSVFEEINEIVSFLTDNIDFFAARFEQKEMYMAWVKRCADVQALNASLHDALMSVPSDESRFSNVRFRNVIMGTHGNNGLLHGQETPIRNLLLKNEQLRILLGSCMRRKQDTARIFESWNAYKENPHDLGSGSMHL